MMDKKSLFCQYGHMFVETDLKHRFHGGDHAESWRARQDRDRTVQPGGFGADGNRKLQLIRHGCRYAIQHTNLLRLDRCLLRSSGQTMASAADDAEGSCVFPYWVADS